MTQLPRVTALRYIQPLREGGSLPAVVDTERGLFVVKFRGAGQGPRALVAEIIVALLARALDLPTPEIALVEVLPVFGRGEPDPEIQDLLRASHGTNVGLRYLDGAFNFATGPAQDLIDPSMAARLVWLDAFVTNPDRTPRNPNLLIWQRKPWLIDHGAALYAHHDWERVDRERTRTPFPLIRDHVLLTHSGDLGAADEMAEERLDGDTIDGMLHAVPDELLGSGGAAEPEAERQRYRRYLLERLEPPREFVREAERARLQRLAHPGEPLGVRR